MKNKKKYVAIVTSFMGLKFGYLHVARLFTNQLSKNFDKIYVINTQNLRFFPKFARSTYMEEDLNEHNCNPLNMPENFVLFNPKNIKEFSDFLHDKELLIINNFNKHFFDLPIQIVIKKFKLKQVQVSYSGRAMSGSTQTLSLKHFFKTFVFYFNQTLFKKITVLLSNLGITPKLDIRFLSDKKVLEDITGNVFKNFLYKKKLLWAKEIKLVNSMAYDVMLENQHSTSEDYIVHLDASLNNRHETELRGEWPKEKVEKHYYYLAKFLKKLSKEFNKEVIVTIHPGYDLEEHQSYLKDFKVLKYKTSEYIYKAFLVTAFDSSAVTEAILLKKRLLGINSNYMSDNETLHAKVNPKRFGYPCLNTEKDYNFNKEELLQALNKSKSNYDKYINKYHCHNPNQNGTQYIIETIKDRFFKEK